MEGAEAGASFVSTAGNSDALTAEVSGGYRAGNVSTEELTSANGTHVNERSIGGRGSGRDLWYCLRNVCAAYRRIRVSLLIHHQQLIFYVKMVQPASSS